MKMTFKQHKAVQYPVVHRVVIWKKCDSMIYNRAKTEVP